MPFYPRIFFSQYYHSFNQLFGVVCRALSWLQTLYVVTLVRPILILISIYWAKIEEDVWMASSQQTFRLYFIISFCFLKDFYSTIYLFLIRYKVHLLLVGKMDYSQGQSLELILNDVKGHRIRAEVWKESYNQIKDLPVRHITTFLILM